jgi:hypothetical protein
MNLRNILLTGILFASIGCVGIYESPDHSNNGSNNNNNNYDPNPYVNTYVQVPPSIKALIAPYVRGYFSPQLYRYCEYLSNPVYDPYDLPCYVRADFNGDYIDDYAFLFSSEERYTGYWDLHTRLIVVLSTPYGMEIACDVYLGTVTGDACIPIEEFWSICYLEPGYYTTYTYVNGIEIIETVLLPNDAFFLASLDPDEEAIFYAVDDEVWEMEWVEEKLVKRNAATLNKSARRGTIQFKKNIEGRKRMIQKK